MAVSTSNHNNKHNNKSVALLTQQALALSFNFVAALAVIALNKQVFGFFPFPGCLSTLHYAISTLGIELWMRFTTKSNEISKTTKHTIRQHAIPFAGLVVSWALCTPLSNGSLFQNSVGFYQMAKLLTTPTVVVVNYLAYGQVISLQQGILLWGACLGVWLVTVNDLQLQLAGAILALLSVSVTAAQKIMNSHLQQHCDLSSLELLRCCLPLMTILSATFAPLIDPPGSLFALWQLSVRQLLLVLVSGLAGLGASYSATLVYGTVGVLAHVLLGQMKLCSVLLVGALVYDAPTNLQSKWGAALGVLSISAYTYQSIRQSSNTNNNNSHNKSNGMNKNNGHQPSHDKEASHILPFTSISRHEKP